MSRPDYNVCLRLQTSSTTTTNTTAPSAYTQAIPTMQLSVKALISTIIVLLVCASLAILLGLYYYSPARRTRMEEEDLEGIELEAGGEGNIRRRAGRFVTPPPPYTP
ncbi:hypothetical protein CPB84DRAFT_1851278 [Gymnopilus junonius]|uniref:Uncharacterized protein n=1 Tax=Gymnopilus junonius TaxID=109634 RepID=A0A9P5NGI0_GYMJU|nr:hypothetical protein CPB84DRAFT_1851278 [Gymnopilus junonius]